MNNFHFKMHRFQFLTSRYNSRYIGIQKEWKIYSNSLRFSLKNDLGAIPTTKIHIFKCHLLVISSPAIEMLSSPTLFKGVGYPFYEMEPDGMYPAPRNHPGPSYHTYIWTSPWAFNAGSWSHLFYQSPIMPLFQIALLGPARGPHQSSPHHRSHMLLDHFALSGILLIRIILSLAMRVMSKYGKYHQFTLKFSAIYQWHHPTIYNCIHYIKKCSILQGTKTNMVHCLPFDFSRQPT